MWQEKATTSIYCMRHNTNICYSVIVTLYGFYSGGWFISIYDIEMHPANSKFSTLGTSDPDWSPNKSYNLCMYSKEPDTAM